MEPGDTVKLKSGGPRMTIESRATSGGWLCVWFDDSGVKKMSFAEHLLVTDNDRLG